MTNDHQFLLINTVLSAGWLVVALAMWSGWAKKPDQKSRQVLAAVLLMWACTFLPLPGLMPRADLAGPWLAVAIGNIVLMVLAAVVIWRIHGKGSPAVVKTMSRYRFATYTATLVLAIGGVFFVIWYFGGAHKFFGGFLLPFLVVAVIVMGGFLFARLHHAT